MKSIFIFLIMTALCSIVWDSTKASEEKIYSPDREVAALACRNLYSKACLDKNISKKYAAEKKIEDIVEGAKKQVMGLLGAKSTFEYLNSQVATEFKKMGILVKTKLSEDLQGRYDTNSSNYINFRPLDYEEIDSKKILIHDPYQDVTFNGYKMMGMSFTQSYAIKTALNTTSERQLLEASLRKLSSGIAEQRNASVKELSRRLLAFYKLDIHLLSDDFKVACQELQKKVRGYKSSVLSTYTEHLPVVARKIENQQDRNNFITSSDKNVQQVQKLVKVAATLCSSNEVRKSIAELERTTYSKNISLENYLPLLIKLRRALAFLEDVKMSSNPTEQDWEDFFNPFGHGFLSYGDNFEREDAINPAINDFRVVSELYMKQFGARYGRLIDKYKKYIMHSKPYIEYLRNAFLDDRQYLKMKTLFEVAKSELIEVVKSEFPKLENFKTLEAQEEIKRITAEIAALKLWWAPPIRKDYFTTKSDFPLPVLIEDLDPDTWPEVLKSEGALSFENSSELLDFFKTYIGNYWTEKDLKKSRLGKINNACYNVSKTYGRLTYDPGVIVFPGMFYLVQKSPLSLITIFAHELAHHLGIGPAFLNGHTNLVASYPKLVKCLSSSKSLGLENDNQYDEAIADWYASKVVARYLEKNKSNRESFINVSNIQESVMDIVGGLCGIDADNNMNDYHPYYDDLGEIEEHPATILRVNGIFGANLTIRKYLGCNDSAPTSLRDEEFDQLSSILHPSAYAECGINGEVVNKRMRFHYADDSVTGKLIKSLIYGENLERITQRTLKPYCLKNNFSRMERYGIDSEHGYYLDCISE